MAFTIKESQNIQAVSSQETVGERVTLTYQIVFGTGQEAYAYLKQRNYNLQAEFFVTPRFNESRNQEKPVSGDSICILSVGIEIEGRNVGTLYYASHIDAFSIGIEDISNWKKYITTSEARAFWRREGIVDLSNYTPDSLMTTYINNRLKTNVFMSHFDPLINEFIGTGFKKLFDMILYSNIMSGNELTESTSIVNNPFYQRYFASYLKEDSISEIEKSLDSIGKLVSYLLTSDIRFHLRGGIDHNLSMGAFNGIGSNLLVFIPNEYNFHLLNNVNPNGYDMVQKNNLFKAFAIILRNPADLISAYNIGDDLTGLYKNINIYLEEYAKLLGITDYDSKLKVFGSLGPNAVFGEIYSARSQIGLVAFDHLKHFEYFSLSDGVVTMLINEFLKKTSSSSSWISTQPQINKLFGTYASLLFEGKILERQLNLKNTLIRSVSNGLLPRFDDQSFLRFILN